MLHRAVWLVRRRKTRSLRASLLKRGRLRENKTKWTDELRERERGGGGERVGEKDKMDKASREPERSNDGERNAQNRQMMV